MKNGASEEGADGEMRPEYAFDYAKARPNPFTASMKAGEIVRVMGTETLATRPLPPVKGWRVSLNVGAKRWNRFRREHPGVILLFEGLDLSGCDLSGYDLSGLDLRGVPLRRAVLRDADLRGADLSGADLAGADVTGARLDGAKLDGEKMIHPAHPVSQP